MKAFSVQFGTVMAVLMFACAAISCSHEAEGFYPQSYDDLRGHTICVMEGSVEQDIADKQLKQMGVNILYFASISDCTLAVHQGRAEMFFGSDIQSFSDAFRTQNMAISYIVPDHQSHFAFGMRKGNTLLMEQYRAFYNSISANGTLDEIVGRWFDRNNTDYHASIKIPPTSGDATADNGGKILKVGISGVKYPAEVLIDNMWTGLEIEILQMFAAEYDYKLNIEVFDFHNLIPALQSERIDIASATMVINEERATKIDFTPETAVMNLCFIVNDRQIDKESVWSKFKNNLYSSLVRENRWKLIAGGLKVTVIITFFALIGGALLGALICGMNMSRKKWAVKTARAYIYIMRNLPMLVFLMLMFYVFLADTGLSPITIAVIAFSMNSAAFMSEIFRSGLQSVDVGQVEAGRALGCPASMTFFRIVFPQALHTIAPVFQNECISLLKGTSIVGFISIIDLSKASDLIRSASFEALCPLLIISLLYFLLAGLLTFGLEKLFKHI